MPYLRQLRIFLSSPGDVASERTLAMEVIDQLQYDPFLRGKVALTTVAWDRPGGGTPMRATMTPQEAIDQGLAKPSECDIVIVIFWSRMGTPLAENYRKPDGNRYLSGTEYEYWDALLKAQETGQPKLVVYRRTEEPVMGMQDADFLNRYEQYQRVQRFFADFANPDGSAGRGYNVYKTPDEFRSAFELHLKVLVNELLQDQVETPELLETDGPPIWNGSPFPGLRAFTDVDAPIYFGRGKEIDALVKRIAETRFVAVVGASGSGKSSLVGAGLIPRLRANADQGSKDWILPTWDAAANQWHGLRFTPGEVGDDPFAALGVKLAPLIGGKPRMVSQTLAQDPTEVAKMIEPLFASRPEWAEALWVIDQFEELFTLASPRFVDSFVALIETLITSNKARIVLTLRSDFYARCLDVPRLAAILEPATFPLSAPTTIALHEMITRPAARAGLTFEKGLPEQILADTGTEPGALALMAYALDELYRQGADDGELQLADYQALGGVQGAIGQRAEAVFATLDSEAQNALPTVFREIVEVDERGEPTRRRAALDLVAKDPGSRHLLEALTDERARLLVQDRDTEGNPIVEVAHEALLRKWTRLRTWIDSAQNQLRLRRQISQAASEWEAQQHAPDYLWAGSRLDEARRWLEIFPGSIKEKTFILASVEHETAAAQAETERKRREAETARRADQFEHRARQFRRASAGLGLMAAVAIGATILAIATANDANLRGNTASTNEAQAQGLRSTVESEATLSALEQDRAQVMILRYGIVPMFAQTPLPATVVAQATARANPTQIATEVQIVEAAEMVKVPEGCFLMGSVITDGQPPAEVCFDRPFWIDRYEVTRAQYRLCVTAGGCSPAPLEASYTYRDTQPVNNILWQEARTYCEWRGAKLPTEAEWEYAARGPDGLVFPWGDQFVPENAIYVANPVAEPHDVGERSPDSFSWVGAADMSGNVWEWVSTAYDTDPPTGAFPLPYVSDDGREDLERTHVLRGVRGGSFNDAEDSLRASNRAWFPSETRTANNELVGVRCARG